MTVVSNVMGGAVGVHAGAGVVVASASGLPVRAAGVFFHQQTSHTAGENQQKSHTAGVFFQQQDSIRIATGFHQDS